MKVRPMLGQYQIEGIESIESAEQRALVEHRVPGMEGSYLQDLGSAPNAIVIAGTRYGDEARDAFLERVRELFKTGEPTTFAADINTATDLTDVVIEDLQVAEVAGEADSFRYVMRLRKYVEPPEPPAAGLPGLDSDLLDQAAGLVDVLDTLDALASAPNLGDPTPPLRGALDGVRSATTDLGPAASEAQAGLGAAAEQAGAVPDPEEVSGSLSGVLGDAASGGGIAGALGALEQADVPGQRAAVVASLTDTVAGSLPGPDASPAGPAAEQLGQAAGSLPDAASLSAPLADPLAQIQRLAGPEGAGAAPAAIAGLASIREQVQGDPAGLLSEAVSLLDRFEETGLGRSVGSLGELGETLTTLTAALEAPAAELVRDRLISFLGEHSRRLAGELVPGGGPAASLAAALESALSRDRVDGVRTAAEALGTALEQIAADAAGPGTTTAPTLTAAEDALRRLVETVPAIVRDLDAALSQPAASADGLATATHALHAGLRDIDVVDFASLPEAVTEAFSDLRAAIASLDLQRALAPVEETLRQISAAIAQLDLGRLTDGLDSVQGEVEGALGRLDGATLEVLALVRSGFTRVREALSSATRALGEMGEDGRFRFHAEAEIESVLGRARDAISDDVQPALTEFRQAVTAPLGEVTAALDGVGSELESARAQIASALETATAQLEQVDVTAVARDLVERLGTALDSLGTIDLDAAVDPVVAEIEGMRDSLRAIDPASLNDILRAALGTAKAALAAIDFPADITAVLMAELDELLAQPVEAIAGLQERLDAALEQFALLDPSALTEPLEGAFTPLTDALDQLRLDALVAPLEEWHAGTRAALEQVMPETLLAPVVAIYDDLARTVTSISPDGVAQTLEDAMAAAKGELARLEPGTLVRGLTDEMASVQQLVAGLSPELALAPATGAFDRITEGIRALDPAGLVAPLTALSGVLEPALAGITDADAQRASDAISPLREAAAACDPSASFALAASATAEAADRLASLDLETRLAAVRRQRQVALDALAGAGGAAADSVARVGALDPLADAALTQAIADLGRVRGALAAAFPSAEPPAAVTQSHGEVRTLTEGLVPPWARGTPTAEGLRGAFLWIDPSTIASGVTGAFEEALEQWSALDPRRMLAPLEELHGQVAASLESLDPEAIAARIDALVGGIGERLDALDLGVLRADASALRDEVGALVAGLDPRPAIDRLSELAGEVRDLVDALNPAELLRELEGPVDAARELVGQFDPAAIAESLEPAFARIREMLTAVSLESIIEPLTDRLDSLRDELEAALRRTEGAFRELLAAIPS